MTEGRNAFPLQSDVVTRRVDRILHTAALRAYAYPRPHDEGHDPQLCPNCQWIRPKPGHTLCEDCEPEATDG